MKIKRLSKKLDYIKIGLFKIKFIKRPVNYKLELLENAKRYPVFYISFLKKANDTEPIAATFGYKTEKNDIYEIEKIL